MERLEILTKLYTIENRLNNVILPDDELLAEKNKFNHVFSLLTPYNSELKFNNPSEFIHFMIRKYNYPKNYMVNKTKKKEYVEPRQITMIFIRRLFKEMTLIEIANYTGQHHAMVLHSEKAVKKIYDTDKEFRKSFDEKQISILGKLKIF